MQTVYFLFGEMGCGKTHQGVRFADAIMGHFYDGDEALPLPLRKKMLRGQPLTRKEVETFVREHLSAAVLKQAAAHSRTPIVVAQALYCDADRVWLRRYLNQYGLDVIFSHVRVGWWQNMKQLWSRKNGSGWILSWLISKPFFEEPSHFCVTLKKF